MQRQKNRSKLEPAAREVVLLEPGLKAETLETPKNL